MALFVEGRHWAVSACASRFTAVACFYGPCVFTYYMGAPSKGSLDRAVAVVYIVLTPLLNPLIYTLRNKDAKAALSGFKRWSLFT